MKLDFIKMNGAGNDFIIFDARKQEISLSPEQIRALSARDNPVTKGCDQLLILCKSDKADVFMQIYNADGGEVDACGNATRCIADMLYKDSNKLPVSIQTNVAVLQGIKMGKYNDIEYTMVDMGMPKFGWNDIPLAMPIEEATKKVEALCGLKNPIFVNMGNPHVVFFLNDLPTDENVRMIGSRIETYTDVFPERVNVTFAAIQTGNPSEALIDAKVWERGAGRTKSCGTGACATLSAAIHKGIIQNKKGNIWFLKDDNMNMLSVEWQKKDGNILLGGRIEKEFEGTVEI